MLRTINLAIDEIIYDCEHAQGTGDTARQLCFPRGHCPPYGAEIRDVLPAVPVGTGVGTAGVEAFLAGDVPLAAACGGRIGYHKLDWHGKCPVRNGSR